MTVADPTRAGEIDEETIPPLREAPATLILGALWVVVYLAMAWQQGSFRLMVGGQLSGNISTLTTHAFGDQTPAAIGRGEIWRALTSTFIHFSLLHLATNLIGLLIFGRMVEGWYGSGPTVAIYAAIGLFGNVLSGFIKLHNGADPLRPSGGGSGVAVGLIALIAVAGWRSGSRFGRFVQGMMCILLLTLGLMGAFFPLHDNLGHACGAIIGALIGVMHPRLLRTGRRSRLAAGIVGAVVLASATGALVASDLAESRASALRAQLPRYLQARVELAWAWRCFAEISRRGSSPAPPYPRHPVAPSRPSTNDYRAMLGQALRDLDSSRLIPGSGPAADAFRRMNRLADSAGKWAPTPGRTRAFERAASQVAAEIDLRIREAQQSLPPGPVVTVPARRRGAAGTTK